MELISMSSVGPMARYSDAHVYLAMDVIYAKGRISRSRLAGELGLGEGSTRSLIKLMEDWSVIEVKRSGIELTRFGRVTFENIPMRLVDAYSGNYAIGECQQGMVIVGVADKITNGMKQRDSGIRNGSEGATVFTMRDGRIGFMDDWDIEERDPDFAEHIRSYGLGDGDVFLLVGAKDQLSARLAAISIGLELL